MKKYSICGVVVTYNRKELLLRNINSLLNQSYPVDIVIYDNASTDGTYDYLKENRIIDLPNVTYVKSEHNLGGSGGFYEGEKIAYEKGYDYIWLMDDDGYCVNKDTLLKLIENINEKKTRLNSLVICDTEKMLPTFNIGGCKTYEEIKIQSEGGAILGVGNPYNGTLVPRECFDEIGFTDQRFFIYGDEYDFAARSKKAGYYWKTIIDSVYYHPVNRNVLKEFSLFGHKFDVKDQPFWKWYLETRNSTYNSITHNNNRLIFYFYLRAIIVSLNSKDKILKRLYYGFLGVNDAFKNNFDRPIPFKE